MSEWKTKSKPKTPPTAPTPRAPPPAPAVDDFDDFEPVKAADPKEPAFVLRRPGTGKVSCFENKSFS